MPWDKTKQSTQMAKSIDFWETEQGNYNGGNYVIIVQFL